MSTVKPLASSSALVVVVGFAPSYYFRAFSDAPPLRGLVHLHGAVATSWMLLFLAQASLVSVGRTDIHRRLGMAGVAIATLFVVVSYATAITAARLGVTPPGGTATAGVPRHSDRDYTELCRVRRAGPSAPARSRDPQAADAPRYNRHTSTRVRSLPLVRIRWPAGGDRRTLPVHPRLPGVRSCGAPADPSGVSLGRDAVPALASGALRARSDRCVALGGEVADQIIGRTIAVGTSHVPPYRRIALPPHSNARLPSNRASTFPLSSSSSSCWPVICHPLTWSSALRNACSVSMPFMQAFIVLTV
jgi:hypothetical protein